MKKMAEQPHRSSAVIALFLMFLTVPLSAMVVVFSILGLDSDARAGDPTIDITSEAVQTMYKSGVPHTNSRGAIRTQYGTDSFFPIGLYGPVPGAMGTFSGGGFNATIAGFDSNLTTILSEAQSNNIKVVLNSQDMAHCAPVPANSTLLANNFGTYKNNSNVIGWHLLDDTDACMGLKIVSWDRFGGSAPGWDSTNYVAYLNEGSTPNIATSMWHSADIVYGGSQMQVFLTSAQLDPDKTYTWSVKLKGATTVINPTCVEAGLAYCGTFSTSLQSVRDYINSGAAYGGQTDQAIFHVDAGPLDNDWKTRWQEAANIGDVSVHYNYPITSPNAFCGTGGFNSVGDVAEITKLQTAQLSGSKPSWFVMQDWAGSFFCSFWRHPVRQEARAMAYASIVSGATGLFHFVYDSAGLRESCSEGVIGISASTPISYPGKCLNATSQQVSESIALWNALASPSDGINKEIHSLEPILLSPTASEAYQVFVDQRPISQTPVRTVLKKYQGAWYLLAVNIDNASINTKFVLPGAFSRAEVLFENRDAALSANNQVTDLFSPFDVNVYKLYPKNTMGNMVESQRQVCALYGTNQSSLGIGGMDGGTSVKVGADSFFTFGDNTNLTAGLFLPNSIAKTNDTDAGDCMALTNKTSGGVAQALLPKVSGELLVWPDGMVNTSASTNYFYYMSVRSCVQPEPCASQPLGAWKVRGIGLAKFDTTSLNSTRIGNCSPVTGCLFWKEGDTSFEIAGATAYKHTDGYVYVFLNESANGVFQDAVRLSRVSVGSIENKAAYQYWNGSSWVSNIADSTRIMTFAGGFNGVSIAYNSALGKWTAIYTTNNFSAVSMRTADSITGPWSTADEVLVDCDSVFGADKTLKCYFGRQHQQFEKNSGKTIYVTYANQKTYKPYVHEIVFRTTSAGDSDGDGCTDAKELGTDPVLGGDRNPNDPWDFYDVNGDKRIDLSDVLDILGKFGLGPDNPGYDPKFDRQAPDGTKLYKTAADNDGIDLSDALLNLESFGHGCE